MRDIFRFSLVIAIGWVFFVIGRYSSVEKHTSRKESPKDVIKNYGLPPPQAQPIAVPVRLLSDADALRKIWGSYYNNNICLLSNRALGLISPSLHANIGKNDQLIYDPGPVVLADPEADLSIFIENPASACNVVFGYIPENLAEGYHRLLEACLDTTLECKLEYLMAYESELHADIREKLRLRLKSKVDKVKLEQPEVVVDNSFAPRDKRFQALSQLFAQGKPPADWRLYASNLLYYDFMTENLSYTELEGKLSFLNAMDRSKVLEDLMSILEAAAHGDAAELQSTKPSSKRK